MTKYMVVVRRDIELFYDAESRTEAEEMAMDEIDEILHEYMIEDGTTAMFFEFITTEDE